MWGGRSGRRCTGSRSPGLPQGRGIGYSVAGIMEEVYIAYGEQQTIRYYDKDFVFSLQKLKFSHSMSSTPPLSTYRHTWVPSSHAPIAVTTC